MARRSILSDEELTKGAKAIAEDMRVGETRRVKLARIIDDHLDWFDLARARGLEWTDIIEVLFKAGATRPDGRPLSRGHLSSLVWRKQKSAAMAAAHALVVETSKLKNNRNHGLAPSAATSTGEKKPVTVPSYPAPAAGSTMKAQTVPIGAGGKPDEHEKLLAYMRRSARARGNE